VLELIVPLRYRPAKSQALDAFAQRASGPLPGKTLEVSGRRKDGSEIPVELSISSYRDREDVCAVGVIRDISERTQSRAKLDAMHRQLVDASRQAGMAEVASGVLHNVGNVLNSLNVSATLVADRVRDSRVARLAQVAEMLRARTADLPAFLTTDERGRQLPEYLIALAEHLAGEQTALLDELHTLAGSIEHIKGIINMQQRHARTIAVVEPLQITDLLEDVVRMNAAGFERHRITIVRDYAQVPTVMLDKHVVLQVLVNLVRNAKHALRESDAAQRQLTLRVTCPTDETLCVEVTDNGVGIAPENLDRLWDYGFTTKKDGHGFGLHNSALAAKAFGGTLRAHSAGPGQGATFILELPLQAVEVTGA
jgi:two-component system sensor kinase FixL